MEKLSIKKIALMVVISFLAVTFSTAQTVYQSKVFEIKLNGTSNLHDWQMKAKNGTSSVAFIVDANNIITSITSLNFTLPAKSLKSEWTAMDNNTYKALKADKNPNISFVLSKGTVTPTSSNYYQLDCIGSLCIAGTTKEVELSASGKYDPKDKSFTVTGVKKIKMTDFNVNPPTAVFGTIKTGNEISIAYNMKFGI
jgi:polyisoprenoid-binding protein YceI